MSIGERITELRKMQNLSQGQLAQAMNVSRQAVSKWENDQTSPDSLKMIRLAEVLDTDIEYLTTGRRNYGRRPPVVLKTVETVEKVIEKPVVQVVEKVVENRWKKLWCSMWKSQLSKRFFGQSTAGIRRNWPLLDLPASCWGCWWAIFCSRPPLLVVS